LNPVENAQRYFKRSRKAKAGLTKIEARLEQLRGQLEELQGMRQSLQTDLEKDKVQELKILLDRLGVQVSPVSSEGRAKNRQFRSRPLTIALNGGWTIMVGRNNLENDRLTHRLAAPGDLWFHAQGVSGAHVILRREGRKDKPSKKVLEETASVAAYFSRARHSKMVPVVYTEKRYVRKPRGAKPGVAVIEREKSLFVEPKLARMDSGPEK
jgi:predicted ribosome quality control (RQC) complex YloA/Tae2 family protein